MAATTEPEVPDLLTGLATTRAIRRYRDEPFPTDDLAWGSAAEWLGDPHGELHTTWRDGS